MTERGVLISSDQKSPQYRVVPKSKPLSNYQKWYYIVLEPVK